MGEDGLANALRTALIADGHQCQTATSGREAYDKCAGTYFDCMVVDFHLAGPATGVGVAKHLQHSRHRPEQIILISKFAKINFETELRFGIVDAFLAKPAEADDLVRLVQKALSPPEN